MGLFLGVQFAFAGRIVMAWPVCVRICRCVVLCSVLQKLWKE